METKLNLPQNFIELDQDEMMYLDGGLGIPNAVAATAINFGVNVIINKFTGGGGAALVRTALRQLGKNRVKGELKRSLGRFMATQAANRISGTVAGLLLGTGGLTVGGMAVNAWDARDRVPNNGWVNF